MLTQHLLSTTADALAVHFARRSLHKSEVAIRSNVRQAVQIALVALHTGRSVDYVLGRDDVLEMVLQSLVQDGPQLLAVRNGAIDFEFVIDATQQPDTELGPFVVGKACETSGSMMAGEPVVWAKLAKRKDGQEVVNGRRLLTFEGELGS